MLIFSPVRIKLVQRKRIWRICLLPRKLTRFESEALNGPITITELSSIVKNIKNNKTPGIDGFPADFFKVFLERS